MTALEAMLHHRAEQPLLSREVYAYVLRHGKAFRWAPRPKGFRHQRKMRNCFGNATEAAQANRGTYVEGFALSAKSELEVHHAWLTLDGETAIDQTWNDPEAVYFGVPFDLYTLSRVMLARGYYGVLDRSNLALLDHR
jgi:hypothetical protein